MANVCADNTDFKLADGRLQLSPHFYQNAVEDFSHLIPTTTPDGTYETITEFDPVIVATAGLYLVSWTIHGYVVLPQPTPGIPLNGGVMGAIAVNSVFRAGTETMIATVNEGTTNTSFPAMGQEGSGSGSMVLQLGANSSLRILGAQEGNGSNVSRIISDNRGRCRITALRISG